MSWVLGFTLLLQYGSFPYITNSLIYDLSLNCLRFLVVINYEKRHRQQSASRVGQCDIIEGANVGSVAMQVWLQAMVCSHWEPDVRKKTLKTQENQDLAFPPSHRSQPPAMRGCAAPARRSPRLHLRLGAQASHATRV